MSVLHVEVIVIDEGAALVSPRGDLDQDSVAQFTSAVERCLAAGRVVLVVNFADVRFCDSSGITALLRSHAATLSRDGSFCVARPRLGLLSRFDLTGLDRIMPVLQELPVALPGRPP